MPNAPSPAKRYHRLRHATTHSDTMTYKVGITSPTPPSTNNSAPSVLTSSGLAVPRALMNIPVPTMIATTPRMRTGRLDVNTATVARNRPGANKPAKPIRTFTATHAHIAGV